MGRVGEDGANLNKRNKANSATKFVSVIDFKSLPSVGSPIFTVGSRLL